MLSKSSWIFIYNSLLDLQIDLTYWLDYYFTRTSKTLIWKIVQVTHNILYKRINWRRSRDLHISMKRLSVMPTHIHIQRGQFWNDRVLAYDCKRVGSSARESQMIPGALLASSNWQVNRSPRAWRHVCRWHSVYGTHFYCVLSGMTPDVPTRRLTFWRNAWCSDAWSSIARSFTVW